MKITSYFKLKYSTPAGLSKEAQKALSTYSFTGQNSVNFSESQITYECGILFKHSMYTNKQTLSTNIALFLWCVYWYKVGLLGTTYSNLTY